MAKLTREDKIKNISMSCDFTAVYTHLENDQKISCDMWQKLNNAQDDIRKAKIYRRADTFSKQTKDVWLTELNFKNNGNQTVDKIEDTFFAVTYEPFSMRSSNTFIWSVTNGCFLRVIFAVVFNECIVMHYFDKNNQKKTKVFTKVLEDGRGIWVVSKKTFQTVFESQCPPTSLDEAERLLNEHSRLTDVKI